MKRTNLAALTVIILSIVLVGAGRAEGGPPGLSGGGLESSSAIFNGAGSGDLFSASTAGVGDVNGDGFDDLLIGSPGFSFNKGGAFLYLGRRSGWTMEETIYSAKAVYEGLAVNEKAGYSVAGAGDVNGDGFDDMLIGAPAYSSNQGRVYLVLGGSNPPIDLNSALIFTGEASSKAGASVAGAGDVNGDGYADMLIGAPNYNGSLGRVYLVYGSASPSSLNLNTTLFFTGEIGDYAGTSVAGAGDFNGDGYADMLIGATGATTFKGTAYLVYGSASLSSISLILATAYSGVSVNDEAGTSVAGAGDVNGDGFADILIGAPGRTSSDGVSYLVLGKPTYQASQYLDAADAAFAGQTPDVFSGGRLAGAGDVNADGYSDILIGAWSYGSSQTYLLLGSAKPASVSLSSADVTYKDETNGDPAYFSVSGVGDTNGDGYEDLLFGVPGYFSSQGRAYLVLSDYGAANGGPAGSAPGARYRAVIASGNQPSISLGGVNVDYSSGDRGSVYITHFAQSTCSQDTTTNGLLWQVESQRGPNAAATFRFHYNDWQIAGINEAGLKLYTRQKPCQAWVEDTGAVLDTNTNHITSSSANNPYAEYTISATAPGPTVLNVNEWFLQPARQPVWTALAMLVLTAAVFIYDWRRHRQKV